MHRLISAFILMLALTEANLVLAEDRINMEALSIIGNKELPNILYILPWKHSDLPDMVEMPLSGLINDALKPIDRKTLLRQQLYQRIINEQNTATNLTEQKKLK